MTPDPLSPVGLVVRALQFAGLLAVVGAVAFHYVVILPLIRRNPHAVQIGLRLSARAAVVGAVGAIIVLLSAFGRLKLQLDAMADPAGGVEVDFGVLLLQTMWGRAWIAQLVLAVFALMALNWLKPPEPLRPDGVHWRIAAICAVGLAFTPSFSGHAIGSENWTALAVIADGLHVLGAGAWVGAMAVLAAGLGIPRQAGDHTLAVAMIAAFSPLALSAAATVSASGVLSAAMHLGSLEALTSSRYGRTVLIKVGMVLAVVGLGAFNWKRAGPRVMQQIDERPMLASIRAELAVGILVLLATAALVVTPPPGEE